ncbi:PTS fructose transporter subunit IIA [[Clostridium] spiroforme]|nr:PTS fructose transporter subunit IIA [Thomasclavelia spiroformis]MBM6879182.1 PTS fructose transporter subunit IIA [Thomasclavelia spiroformis]
MKYLILVSHGDFAKGLKSSLNMLAGQRDDVIASGLEDGKTADEFATVFQQDIAKVQEGDQVVLLADIIGGSPLTTALNVLDKKAMLDKTLVIGGMNLPLALTAVLMKDNLDGDALVSTIISEATGAIKQFETQVSDEEDI